MTSIDRVLRSCAGILFAAVIASTSALAQRPHDQDDDHDHDHDRDHHEGRIHFGHPLFTESPSPDTKLRLDYLHASIARSTSDHELRIEGEYAFNHSVSIEANVPLTSRSSEGVRKTAVGSGEIALKLASYAAAKRGVLLGGGIAFGIPTGNEEKGIGSNHLVEIEPYVDIGFMRGPLELVSFASYSASVHRSDTDEEEKSFAVAASLLYHVTRALESLVEIETRRAVSGDESGTQIVNAGVGAKYHVPNLPRLVIGLGGRIPLTGHREFRREILVSAFWHF